MNVDPLPVCFDDAKPCPFCGSKDLEFQRGTPDREGVPMNVICVDCGATGPFVYVIENRPSYTSVIDQWNGRASV